MKLYGLGLRVLCERGVLISLLEVEYRHVSIRTGCRCRSMGECWERLDSRSGELEEQHDALAEGREEQEAQPVATDASLLNRRWRRRLHCGTRARARREYNKWVGRRKTRSQRADTNSSPDANPHIDKAIITCKQVTCMRWCARCTRVDLSSRTLARVALWLELLWCESGMSDR